MGKFGKRRTPEKEKRHYDRTTGEEVLRYVRAPGKKKIWLTGDGREVGRVDVEVK